MQTYPILEHDPLQPGMIEPSRTIQPGDVPEHCVICFFQEILDKVIAGKQARKIFEDRWEDGPHPVYEIMHNGHRLAFFHPGVGAAPAAARLEEVIAHGCRKFIACGGAGVLDREINVGHLLVVNAALRDEGTSYHYLTPGREIAADPVVLSTLVKTLDDRRLPYRIGKTWTTDAPYRETRTLVALRRQEGCLAVEMECSALMAVARYRGVNFGQLLYGGDDLGGSEWDERGWQDRSEVRDSLFWLCADACLALP